MYVCVIGKEETDPRRQKSKQHVPEKNKQKTIQEKKRQANTRHDIHKTRQHNTQDKTRKEK